ncbi:hypothetical protein R3P38DRAFT_2792068 [Favolaschia claudopus]|uniref:Uncharacterized protein n=1 Tax=Favolaschia claudopus TaxID=2862362 RepID=A0AAW0AF30_9AGAR
MRSKSNFSSPPGAGGPRGSMGKPTLRTNGLPQATLWASPCGQLSHGHNYTIRGVYIGSLKCPHQGLLLRATFNEFFPFTRSQHPQLLTAAHDVPSPPLRAGDRVVVASGYYKDASGFISEMRTQAEGLDKQNFAKIVEKERDLYLQPSLQQPTIVNVADVKRHGLDFSFAPRIGDRVRSARNPAASGCVSKIDFERSLLDVDGPDGRLHLLEVEDTLRVWQLGDLVRVRWGDFGGRVGYIVSMQLGKGLLDIFDMYRVDKQRNYWSGDRQFRVRAADVDALPIGDLRRPPVVTANTVDHTRRYKDLVVLVAETGANKGVRGRIVGDHDSRSRAAMLQMMYTVFGDERGKEEEHYHFGILLTIQRPTGEFVENVPIEDVVLERSMLPLLDDNGLPQPVVWDDTLRAYSPSRESGSTRETNGDWLSIPGLGRKRVDVVMTGVSGVETLASKVREMEGRRGYLLLPSDVPKRDKKRQNITKPHKSDKVNLYGATAGGAKHPIEPKYLRPCRTTEDGHTLLEVEERVVILGGDVDGDMSKLARYGRTAPMMEHKHGHNVVAVNFPLETARFFHVAHLCLAKNVKIQSADGIFEATLF